MLLLQQFGASFSLINLTRTVAMNFGRLRRSSTFGAKRPLPACPRHNVVAAAGRPLHKPALAGLVRCAAAQQDGPNTQQPRTRSKSTKGANRGATATSGIAITPGNPASAHSSAPSSALSSSICSSSGGTGSSSQLDGAQSLHSLESCMHLVALHSACLHSWHNHSSKNMSASEQRQQQLAAGVLGQHAKPGDRWLFVRCGSLLDSQPGPGSAALAVLQLWPIAEGKGDYTLWRLGNDGLPTGDAFFSLTEFEKLSDRYMHKKAINSISVLDQPELVQHLQEELLWQHQHSSIKSYALGSRLLTWMGKKVETGFRLLAKGGPEAEPVQRAVSAARAGHVNKVMLARRAQGEDADIFSSACTSSSSSSNAGDSSPPGAAGQAAALDARLRWQRRLAANRMLASSSSSSRAPHSSNDASNGVSSNSSRSSARMRSDFARRRQADRRRSATYRSALGAASASRRDTPTAQAHARTGRYIGRIRRQPGEAAHAAALLAAAAAAGPAPVYVWPAALPDCLPTVLELDIVQLRQRKVILADIAAGKEDLADTHVALAAVVPAAAAAAAASRGSAYQAVAVAAAAAVAELPPLPVAADPPAVAEAAAAASSSSPSAAAAAAAAAAALTAVHQVYRAEDLQQRAAAAEAARASSSQGQQVKLVELQVPAVVPDANQPFTITMHNPKDGLDYVVAHYEPHALHHAVLSSNSSSSSGNSHNAGGPAAQLCELFNSRKKDLRMQRVSAEQDELMTLAGSRIPVHGGGYSSHYGRYHDDVGAEADCFALDVWPDLRTVGGFRQISSLWVNGIAQLVWSSNAEAAAQVRGDADKENELSSNARMRRRVSRRNALQGAASSSSGNVVADGSTQDVQQQQQQLQLQQQGEWRPKNSSPPNYPSPCLLGSPFTTLAVTHNYHSLLHAEPREHPFSYIVWLDVLGAGSEMQVGYFWLNAGLAFTPLNGSALYIDVRLVPHCSEPCRLTKHTDTLEGRYGAALFIKPAVVQANAKLWAQFDQHLQDKLEQRLAV